MRSWCCYIEAPLLIEQMPPSVGDPGMKDVAGLTSSGIATNVGKAASALLAKHVRTLEILHSLQKNNAQLKEEIQVRKIGCLAWLSCLQHLTC